MNTIIRQWTVAVGLLISVFVCQTALAAVTVPAGTSFLVRLSQTLSSDQLSAGHRFTARLEADLVADGQVVAARGSTVYGRITQAKKSRRASGTASIAFTLTDIMIDNQLKPIVTDEVGGESANTAGKTASTTARTAAIGGLIGGSSGAKDGAKVGLGVSLLNRGNSATIPSGTLLDFRLMQAFSS